MSIDPQWNSAQYHEEHENCEGSCDTYVDIDYSDDEEGEEPDVLGAVMILVGSLLAMLAIIVIAMVLGA